MFTGCQKNFCRNWRGVTILILLAVLHRQALAGSGNCQNFDFPKDAAGQVDWLHAVKVIKQGTPVYRDAAATVITGTLNFNEQLRVLKVQGDRVQAGHAATLSPVGWVERAALLCAVAPARGESGLEQRLYLRTAAAVRPPQAVPVKAYPSADLQECAGRCRELSPLAGYFVFDVDERQHSYLLSETAKLDDTSQLVGWVSGAHSVIWETMYGLRPREQTGLAAERPVCAYPTREDALRKQHCLWLPGGDGWFLSDFRLPLLARVEVPGTFLYKVLLPPPELLAAGVSVSQAQNRGALVEAYIPGGEDVVEEVWLKSDDLDKWLSLLREFENARLDRLSGAELRQAFVFTLADALAKILRKPLHENTGEPLRAYLQQQGGVPVRDDSPLFRYSINELMNPAIVLDCEIVRLLIWTHDALQILNIVYHGNRRPVYKVEKFPGECPGGAAIPFIASEIQAAPLGPDPNMRYNHSFQKANVYWVPKEFLP